jgi:hypothetical protein
VGDGQRHPPPPRPLYPRERPVTHCVGSWVYSYFLPKSGLVKPQFGIFLFSMKVTFIILLPAITEPRGRAMSQHRGLSSEWHICVCLLANYTCVLLQLVWLLRPDVFRHASHLSNVWRRWIIIFPSISVLSLPYPLALLIHYECRFVFVCARDFWCYVLCTKHQIVCNVPASFPCR